MDEYKVHVPKQYHKKTEILIASPKENPNKEIKTPTFKQCIIIGPDGLKRPGWEMWIGDHNYGKADTKKILKEAFDKLCAPPESYHWRAIHIRSKTKEKKT